MAQTKKNMEILFILYLLQEQHILIFPIGAMEVFVCCTINLSSKSFKIAAINIDKHKILIH